MSKAIQVYDDGKLVDIPEEEVENVRCIRKTYGLTYHAWKEACSKKISNPNFISGLLKYLDKFIEHDLQRDEKTWEAVQKIWKNVQPKINKAMHEAKDESNEETAQIKFQKPFDQLSDAEKKILFEGEPSVKRKFKFDNPKFSTGINFALIISPLLNDEPSICIASKPSFP